MSITKLVYKKRRNTEYKGNLEGKLGMTDERRGEGSVVKI
jgi:hypothetical protein